jgi:hypothetical protein
MRNRHHFFVLANVVPAKSGGNSLQRQIRYRLIGDHGLSFAVLEAEFVYLDTTVVDQSKLGLTEKDLSEMLDEVALKVAKQYEPAKLMDDWRRIYRIRENDPLNIYALPENKRYLLLSNEVQEDDPNRFDMTFALVDDRDKRLIPIPIAKDAPTRFGVFANIDPNERKLIWDTINKIDNNFAKMSREDQLDQVEQYIVNDTYGAITEVFEARLSQTLAERGTSRENLAEIPLLYDFQKAEGDRLF